MSNFDDEDAINAALSGSERNEYDPRQQSERMGPERTGMQKYFPPNPYTRVETSTCAMFTDLEDLTKTEGTKRGEVSAERKKEIRETELMTYHQQLMETIVVASD